MQLQKLAHGIKSKDVPKYMIFTGEEWKVQELYIDMICNLGYKKTVCDSVIYAYNALKKKSLSNIPKCYIINEDSEYTAQEKHWKSIQKAVEKSKDILIIKYAKIKKTIKFYSRQKDNIVEFPKLAENVLFNYIKKLVNLSDINIDKLMNICGNDYGRICLECEKITTLNENHDKAFEQLLNENVIAREIGDITFKLTDAILYGDIEKVNKYMILVKQKGEPILPLLTILYNGFKNQLSVLALGNNKKEASIKTGIQGWELSNTFKLVGGYSRNELYKNLMLIQQIESGIKLGKIDDSIALDYLVVNALL